MNFKGASLTRLIRALLSLLQACKVYSCSWALSTIQRQSGNMFWNINLHHAFLRSQAVVIIMETLQLELILEEFSTQKPEAKPPRKCKFIPIFSPIFLKIHWDFSQKLKLCSILSILNSKKHMSKSKISKNVAIEMS